MCLNEFSRKILFVLAAFLTPIEVWAEIPTKAVEVRMNGEVTVGSEAVRLGEVATIYARSMRDFQALSELSVSNMPADGQALRLPRDYLAGRIREALPKGTEFRLDAPEQVVLRLERLGIRPAEFSQEVIRRGRAEGKIPAWAEIEAQEISGFDRLQLMKIGNVRIDPAAEMERWKGDISFKVTDAKGGAPAWVKLRLRWFAESWAAKRRIAAFSGLKPEDFVAQRLEVTNLRDEPLLAADDLSAAIKSARARRAIPAGSALVAAAFERAPDARAGQSMKVVFISESGIRVTTEGALLGSGIVGGEARVKLRSSRKIVTGKLVSGGMMEITL